MCLLLTQRSSIVSFLRDLCAVSVDSRLWRLKRLSFFSFFSSAATLDLSLLASEGLNALQRRRACSVYSPTLTILYATERSPGLIAFACASAARSRSYII